MCKNSWSVENGLIDVNLSESCRNVVYRQPQAAKRGQRIHCLTPSGMAEAPVNAHHVISGISVVRIGNLQSFKGQDNVREAPEHVRSDIGQPDIRINIFGSGLLHDLLHDGRAHDHLNDRHQGQPEPGKDGQSDFQPSETATHPYRRPGLLVCIVVHFHCTSV